MAQLIKLQDYISRYERNTFHYPSQYIRMKQENWQKLQRIWRQEDDEQLIEQDLSEMQQSFWAKWKQLWTSKVDSITAQAEHKTLPVTEEGLKQYFLDELIDFQLKWASSTVASVSFMDTKFERDEVLKYFLQRFPDIYLLMYYPIFQIKNACVDGEIILIGPLGIEIISLLEAGDTIIYAESSRLWQMIDGDKSKRFISPAIALKRSEQILRSILEKHDIDFPIKKVVLSRTNVIELADEYYNLTVVDKRNYDAWFADKRTLISPLKNRQIKAAEMLLRYCQSSSVKRPEWEEDHDHSDNVD